MARCLWLGTVILATFEGEIRRIEFWGQSRETVQETLISKMTRTKWTGSVAYTVECLLFKCKALSSKPSFTKKKKKTPWKVGQAWWVTAVISSTQEAEAGESKVQYGLHSKTLSKQNKEQKGIF
jgi:hypothetical protein